MRPVETALRENGIRLLVSAEKKICAVSKGKWTPRYTPGRIQYRKTETNVRIVEQNDSETFIAKFDENGNMSKEDFVILATTDLHFEDDVALRDKTYQMLARHIMDVKPDLVVFTGDIILSNHQQIDAVRFARMMEELGVYWAFVFGNHEARAEKEYHKYFLLKNMAQYPHCLTKFGPPDLFGYGNFFVHILDAPDHIRQSLVFLDSGRDITEPYRTEDAIPAEVKGYDYLKKNQMQFYRSRLEALRNTYGDFKSMMFFHIPLPEYAEVFDLDENGDYVPSGKAEILYGGQYESIGSSHINSGMFDLIRQLGSTQAVFCGHDHVNDFCALYKGVYLVYVQCGGYETYTMADKRGWEEKDWMQGATLLTVHQDGSFSIKQRFNRDYL
ncbi:MAG: metallophosphoesterase [Acutalibacteraceae bacterium]